jgi:hypothetical protein
MVISGGCLCKSVRYESTAEPLITRVCWCRVCQYIGAGSGTVNIGFRTETFAIRGETRDYRSIADSGNVMHRRFCPSCGVHVSSEAEVRPQLIFVRVGTLDDPNIAKPALTIWAAQAPDWACLNEALPRCEGQPPPAA